MKNQLTKPQRNILRSLMPRPCAMMINPSRDRTSLEKRGLIEPAPEKYGSRMWSITEAGIRAVRGAEIMDRFE